ncbi:DNA-binding response regulator [bacterium]|jgi:response regulators consisting of a cheY-like receiver domain and a winged-helix DNA-binding domain|nr:DNA-binding response regulator [bacterium]
MYRVCLVEDEVDLSNLIKTYLEKASYEVVTFYKGQDALNYIENNSDTIHLYILDIMLGDEISGYDIIKKIRENNSLVPVIFTSARDQDLDKIIGLELGSDDYITKPYSPKELVLRVNNIIKRVYKESDNHILQYLDYKIDIDRRIVSENEKEIKLTTLEFDLLLLLMNNKNKSFSRDEILNSVWGDDYFGSDRVVDDLIRRLRKKMKKLNVNTVYGYGYRLS